MAKRRTLSERTKYLSVDEAAMALGMNSRALKRRIQAEAVTPPAKYVEEHRYMFTPDEVEQIRNQLGLPPALSTVEQAETITDQVVHRSNLAGLAARLSEVSAMQRELTKGASIQRSMQALADLQKQIVENSTGLGNINRITGITAPSWAFDSYLQEQANVARRIAELSAPSSYDFVATSDDGTATVIETKAVPGQMTAFENAEAQSDMPSLMEELLAEARETNRLLRTLLSARGVAVD